MLPPPGAFGLIQPAASTCCCCGIVTATVTTTTPSNPNAATMAIFAIEVVDDPSSRDDEPTTLFL